MLGLPELKSLLGGQVVEHELEQEGHVVHRGCVVPHSSSSANLGTNRVTLIGMLTALAQALSTP